jgi:hypothetical protein
MNSTCRLRLPPHRSALLGIIPGQIDPSWSAAPREGDPLFSKGQQIHARSSMVCLIKPILKGCPSKRDRATLCFIKQRVAARRRRPLHSFEPQTRLTHFSRQIDKFTHRAEWCQYFRDPRASPPRLMLKVASPLPLRKKTSRHRQNTRPCRAKKIPSFVRHAKPEPPPDVGQAILFFERTACLVSALPLLNFSVDSKRYKV